jgi:hypothetical protein
VNNPEVVLEETEEEDKDQEEVERRR